MAGLAVPVAWAQIEAQLVGLNNFAVVQLEARPELEVLQVQPAADKLAAAVPDFVVYGEFEDEAALSAFKAHPIYQKSIDIVRPLRDLRMSADFLSRKDS